MWNAVLRLCVWGSTDSRIGISVYLILSVGRFQYGYTTINLKKKKRSNKIDQNVRSVKTLQGLSKKKENRMWLGSRLSLDYAGVCSLVLLKIKVTEYRSSTQWITDNNFNWHFEISNLFNKAPTSGKNDSLAQLKLLYEKYPAILKDWNKNYCGSH